MVNNSSETPTLPIDTQSVNILIVEDDRFVQEVLQSYVNSFGYSCSVAKDGQLAIEEMKKKRFDIILTDINMPNMDGMELLKYTKEHYPNIGVIVVTGLSEEYSYVDVINAGAIDYMTKPFEGDELKAKLFRVIREQTLVRELEQISICDSLTGIFNRRHFDVKINEELRRGDRQKYSVFLSLIDVDHFKEYNDKYGHQRGDELLATIGEILLRCARFGVDYAFRYGGDEFAMIITQTDKKQAIKVAERVQATYDANNFEGTSLSFGLAEFKRNDDLPWEDDIKAFINTADKMLYQAKHTGRAKISY